MIDSLPKPSVLLIIASVLVIVTNLFFLAIFIAGIVVERDPILILGSVLFVPLFLTLAVQQYRGTFRYVPTAATTVSVILNIIAGFAIFAFVTASAESIADGIGLRPMMSILTVMLLIAGCTIAIGRLNGLWARQLRNVIRHLESPPFHRGLSLRELFLGVAAIAGTMGITTMLSRTSAPPFAEHVESSAAPMELPANATDVSYAKGFRGTIAFEFTTSEIAFRKWVDSGIGSIESDSARVPTKEIDTPFEILRYNTYAPDATGADDILIRSGLYYYWSKEDRGVYAAFDRKTNRAYYHAHFH